MTGLAVALARSGCYSYIAAPPQSRASPVLGTKAWCRIMYLQLFKTDEKKSPVEQLVLVKMSDFQG